MFPATTHPPGRIIAVSVTHGTGKTTSVYMLAADLKIKNPGATLGVVSETASQCPWPINKEATHDAQSWIFHTQICAELQDLDRWQIVVSDRTVVDAIAYTWYIGYHDLALAMSRLAAMHLHVYKEILFRKIADNDYLYDDGLRESEDDQWRSLVEAEMLSTYNKCKSWKG